MTDRLRLMLLGEPRLRTVDVDEEVQEVALPGSTAATVLALLAVQPDGVVALDRLVEEVWPDVRPDAARSRVHVQVSRLRRRLRGTGLQIASRLGGYVLLAEPEAVDVRLFGQLVERAEREAADGDWPAVVESTSRASQLWRGEPFVDMTAAALELERSHLLERRRSMLELRGRALIELGRAAEAIAVGAELRHADPYGELGAWVSMRALAAAGRRADALSLFDGYRRLLAEELGLDPGSRLVDLQHEVLRGDSGAAATRGAAVTSWRAQDPPAVADVTAVDAVSSGPGLPRLVGRNVELSSIGSVVTDLGRGRSRVLLLEGEAGIGRSALARHAAVVAERQGLRVIRAHGVDAAQAPPLSLWHQVGCRLDVAFGAGEVAASGDVASVPSLVRAVLEAACDRPTLLVLDDVHRADDASLEALRHLVSEIWDQPLAVIATRQFHGMPSTPAKELAWTRLSQEHTAAVFELSPLDLAEVSAMVGVPEEQARSLLRRTGGNPQLLRELVAGSARRSHDDALPCGIRSLVRSRLVTVPPMTRALLAAAAVAGPCFDLELLARVLGLEEGAVALALSPAVETGLIKPERDHPCWSFRHEIQWEGVLDLVPARRRRQLEHRLSAAHANEFATSTAGSHGPTG